jgi:replicative DNA helicase
VLTYIIKSFVKDIEVYNKYFNRISTIKVDQPFDKILGCIGDYYKEYTDHTYISKDELTEYLKLCNPHLKDESVYVHAINRIYDCDVSDSLAETKIKQLIEQDAANQIAQICIPAISGEAFGIFEKIREIIEHTEEHLEKQQNESLFLTNDLRKIYEKQTEHGLTWKLHCLMDSLGALPGTGKIIHLASRPNAGKTTLLASEVTHMCTQLKGDECILWIHNEEDGGSIQERWYQAMCNATHEQLIGNIDKAQEIFEKRGGNRILMHDNDNVTVENIEKLIIETQPRLVVVDIADHVAFKGDNKVGNGAERLKILYRMFRNLGKKYAKRFPIDFILTGWSDASTEGRKWFGQNNLDGGKTGKPGSTDAIITIGQDGEGEGTARYLAVVRNKLTGKGMRQVVTIDPFRARFIE